MAKLVEVLHPKLPDIEWLFEVGPALFGPDLGNDIADLSGELHVLAAPGGDNRTMEGGTMGDGCQVFSEEEMEQSANKIVMVTRGGCLFIQKVNTWKGNSKTLRLKYFYFSLFFRCAMLRRQEPRLQLLQVKIKN